MHTFSPVFRWLNTTIQLTRATVFVTKCDRNEKKDATAKTTVYNVKMASAFTWISYWNALPVRSDSGSHSLRSTSRSAKKKILETVHGQNLHPVVRRAPDPAAQLLRQPGCSTSPWPSPSPWRHRAAARHWWTLNMKLMPRTLGYKYTVGVSFFC